MSFHGYPRATGDIDLWIRRSEENAKKVWRALEKFQAPLFDLHLNDLTKSDMVFQMGVIPNRIDIITSIDGVDFDEAWHDKEFVDTSGLTIPIISKTHLIINKSSTNRPKDKNDVLWLTMEKDSEEPNDTTENF
jgi:hypothetical protein